ncbi:MAG: hypothetical protein C5B50_26445 [Verrucomicrobia bacterium]|nr:MAG: hypothetical protein C5B50_26445 [Verrucomicrobiota bacterium]
MGKEHYAPKRRVRAPGLQGDRLGAIGRLPSRGAPLASLSSLASVPTLICFILSIVASAAGGPAKTAEQLKREAAVAEFTQRMKTNNYPALFEKAAKEFKVPADILKGVAFAETRWEQLKWPPGETHSPENGMPRPYGIMSLWDNDFFGHSLLESAALIGRKPEELKEDAFQNIRGGAALLRKLYDNNPKPPGTTEADIESWRYAIRKYCGIPQPSLNASHALKVYVFINQGYHQYGIEWEGQPVHLKPIQEETDRIVADEKAKRGAPKTPILD